MNMTKYSYLHHLWRSKPLSFSNKKWLLIPVSITSHHPHRHPPPPLSPPPPPPATSYSYMSSNIHNTRVTNLSQYLHNYQHAHFSTLPTFQLHNDNDDYEVTVKDRYVIRADQPAGHEYWLPQSNLDLLLPPLDVGVFFCYKKNSSETVVNSLKKSLGKVLSTFYPLAGEIVANSQGEPEVVCNNGGVEFVYAHADVELKTLNLHLPDETVKGKLVPKINRGLLSVQVTELNCGAIIVSCAIDHRIADGYSFNMFLVSWAEVTQLKPISNTPYFRSSILNPRRPPRYDKAFDDLYLPTSSLPPPPSIVDQLRSRIYYVSSESIYLLQSEASSKDTKRSKLQSFIAFIWKLIAQEDNDRKNITSRMGVVVCGRQFLTGNSEKESSMLKNRFGNILSIPYGVASNHDLKKMPLNEVTNKVHGFLTNATKEEHFRGLIDWVELRRPEPAVARVYFKLRESDGDAIVVSSGQGLPIKDMNFGWGEPEFGSYHFPWGGQTGYIATMPTARKNGDWLVYMHLKQKHLDLIENKAAHIFIPFSYSHFSFN